LKTLDVHLAESLACSGLTTYTAVNKSQVLPGQNVVIVGAGGLGIMAFQIAKVKINSNVIALDIDDEKIDEIQKNSADEIVNSKTSDVIKRIKDLTEDQAAEV
jgi:alcohol dehydrogenase, propanol-preferring